MNNHDGTLHPATFQANLCEQITPATVVVWIRRRGMAALKRGDTTSARTYSREGVLEAWVMMTLEDRFASDKEESEKKSAEVEEVQDTSVVEDLDDMYPARRVE